MTKIRTALAGLGRIGWQFHLPQISRHENFELTAAVDPVKERLQEIAGAHPECALFEEFDTMLKVSKPDLVVIASPTIFHEKQIIAAFRSGADVFAEKPLTAEVAECENILREMESSGRKLMVYQPRRLDADARNAAGIIASGILGKIHLIRRNISNYNRRNDWQAQNRFAGGMLNNYGVHYIDQICSVTNFDYRCEYCELKRINSLGDAEDFVKVILSGNDGLTAEVEISQSCAFPVNQWHIEGAYGTARYSSETGSWQLRYLDPASLGDIELQNDLAANGRLYPCEKLDWKEDFALPAAETEDFYDNLYHYLTGTGEPLVKVSESYAVIKLIDCARKLNAAKRSVG